MKYYQTEITDNQAVITRASDGAIVYRSKHFRHRWDAEQDAERWIQQHLPAAVTLDVQNMSISVDQILGGMKNG